MHGTRELSPAMAGNMVTPPQNSCAVPPLGHAMAGLNPNMRGNHGGPAMAAMAAMAGTNGAPSSVKMQRYMPPNVIPQQVNSLNFYIFLPISLYIYSIAFYYQHFIRINMNSKPFLEN